MHSSRMRTARALTEFPGSLPPVGGGGGGGGAVCHKYADPPSDVTHPSVALLARIVIPQFSMTFD